MLDLGVLRSSRATPIPYRKGDYNRQPSMGSKNPAMRLPRTAFCARSDSGVGFCVHGVSTSTERLETEGVFGRMRKKLMREIPPRISTDLPLVFSQDGG